MLEKNSFSSAPEARVFFSGFLPTVSREIRSYRLIYRSDRLGYRAAAITFFLITRKRRETILLKISELYPFRFWNQIISTDEKISQSSKNLKLWIYGANRTKYIT